MGLAVGAALLAGLGVSWIGPPADEWPARVSLDLARETSFLPLVFAPDSRTCLISGDGGLRRWNTATGLPEKAWPFPDWRFIVGGVYSPDGQTFAAAIFHHPEPIAIRLLDTSQGMSRATLTTRHPVLFQLAFTTDGKQLRAALGDGGGLKEVVTWDSATGSPLSSRPISAPTTLSRISIAPDGRLMAFIPDRSRSILLWDLETDSPAGSLSDTSKIGRLAHGLSFSADGSTLAAGRDNGMIEIWDVPGRKLRTTWQAHPAQYSPMFLWFGPDGKTSGSTAIASGPNSSIARGYEALKQSLVGSNRHSSSELIILDLATGNRIVRTSSAMFLTYSPDGQTIATLQDDGAIQLRDLPRRPE